MKKEWYKKRVVQVLFHLIGWTIFFMIPSLLRPDFQSTRYTAFRPPPPMYTTENLINYAFLVFIFYINAYFLIPKILNRKKVAFYIFSLVLIFSAALIISHATRNMRPMTRYTAGMEFRRQAGPPFSDETESGIRTHRMRPPGFHITLILTFFAVTFVMAVSTTYRFVIDKIRMDQLNQMRQNEHLKTELSFLRSQISPHFIFNVLNSAVSLARTRSNQLEPTLLKLSNLLRYMLYGADDEKVPLTQEAEYLQSYIDLQKLRFGEDVIVEFQQAGIFFGYGIEPMLLIPFVENAFKHGIGRIDIPTIHINLEEDNGTLNFSVRNKYNPSGTDMKDRNSGIGLVNVKKRLSLLYGDKYTLQVDVTKEWFDIKLNLILK